MNRNDEPNEWLMWELHKQESGSNIRAVGPCGNSYRIDRDETEILGGVSAVVFPVGRCGFCVGRPFSQPTQAV
uniref:Uncharacterized protein n=1 Tax=Picea glauca TaxID=3330 RepID=A0A117NH76_PICGL|nr:hypothetical protein ABT39_MTgene4925 [Picea glauca]